MINKIKMNYKIWSKSYDNDSKTNPAIMAIGNSLLKPIKNKSQVLDYGCGTGRNIKKLLNKQCKITAIDLSPEMLQIAKSKYEDKAEFKLLKSNNFKLKKNSFDVVHACLVLNHIKDLETFYKNCSKVLKKNGLLVFDDVIKGVVALKEPFETKDHFLKREPKYITKNWLKITTSHSFEEHLKLMIKYGFALEFYKTTTIDSRYKKVLVRESYKANKGIKFWSIFHLRKIK